MGVTLRNQQGGPIIGAEIEESPQVSDPYASAMIGDDDPYASALVGDVPNTENLLQRAIKVAQGGAQGFFDSYTLGATNLARRAADNLVPLSPGAEQGFQEMTTGDPTAYAVGAAVPVAHGAQQLAKTGINALFGKQLAKKALPKASGKLTKSIQDVIGKSNKNPQKLGVPKDEMIKVLEDNFSKSKVPSGEQKAVFQRWINSLKTSNKFGKMLTADDVSQIETAFGQAAKYGKRANDPVLQQAAKEVNRFASKRLDLIAEKAGVPEFAKQSLEKSKLLKAAKGKNSFIGNLFRKAVEGGALGAGGTAGYNLFK